jgi:glutathione S-transferase
VKLYVDRGGNAPSPRRVRIFLAEKGIQVPRVELEIHKDNRTPEFKAKNPLSTLPVLELDDGTCISESIAICRYFEELQPEPSLFGTTPLEKATVEMWLRRVELILYLMIDFSGEEGPLPRDARALFRNEALRSLRFFDRVLAEREFIAGPRYSMADVFALSALDFGMRFNGFSVAPEWVNLARWHRSVSARPSAAA